MHGRGKTGNTIKSLFRFSAGEKRGILLLLPLLLVVGIIIAVASRPSFEKSFPELGDREVRDNDNMRDNDMRGDDIHHRQAGGGVGFPDDGMADYADSEAVGQWHSGSGSEAGRVREAGRVKAETPGAKNTGAGELFRFDPNTVTLQELCRLGFTVRTAAGIIKYREKGKRFEIPEDFATCYGVTLEHYTRLEPYIVIGERYKAAPRRFDSPRRAGVSGASGVSGAWSVSSASGARAISASVEDQTSNGHAIPAEQDRSPVPNTGPNLAPNTGRASRVSVEINTADSAALRSVSGIGEVLVGRIMERRRRLGGFARVEQLAEVQGMSEANYERICIQIWVDTCVISKIDVNFASHKTLVEVLGRHPYMTDKLLRKLLKERQLKGGWSRLEEMVEQNIMTRSEAERLAPYLLFTQR